MPPQKTLALALEIKEMLEQNDTQEILPKMDRLIDLLGQSAWIPVSVSDILRMLTDNYNGQDEDWAQTVTDCPSDGMDALPGDMDNDLRFRLITAQALTPDDLEALGSDMGDLITDSNFWGAAAVAYDTYLSNVFGSHPVYGAERSSFLKLTRTLRQHPEMDPSVVYRTVLDEQDRVLLDTDMLPSPQGVLVPVPIMLDLVAATAPNRQQALTEFLYQINTAYTGRAKTA